MLHLGRSLPGYLFVVLVVWTLCFVSKAAASKGGIANVGVLGCNACHSGGSTPTVTLSGPTTVTTDSDNLYTLQIIGSGAQNKGGLNVSAAAGVLMTTGGDDTHIINGEITHKAPKAASGGAVTFTFRWVAPSAPAIITLRAWGNSVNGNDFPDGDRADVKTLDVSVVSEPTPTPTPACAATPLPGCRKPITPGKSTFTLKENVNDAKDTLTWSWTKGDATAIEEFGDPLNGTTTYVLCVYDETGGVSSPVMELEAPPGGLCKDKPCWKATKPGFAYKDPTLNNDGLLQIQLVSGVAGKAKVVVKGKGFNLPMPPPAGLGLLHQDPTVTVQLSNSDGVCWEAEFSTPAKKNDLKQFNDKSN